MGISSTGAGEREYWKNQINILKNQSKLFEEQHKQNKFILLATFVIALGTLMDLVIRTNRADWIINFSTILMWGILLFILFYLMNDFGLFVFLEKLTKGEDEHGRKI